MSGRKVRTGMEISDHLSLVVRIPERDPRELRGQPDLASGLQQSGRGVHGDEGRAGDVARAHDSHQGSAQCGDHQLAARHHDGRDRGVPDDGSRRAKWRMLHTVRRSARCSGSWAGPRCIVKAARRSGRRSSATSSSFAQGGRGVNARGTAGGQPCGGERCDGQNCCRDRKRERIAVGHTE